MSINLRPLSPALGAEVRGLDLGREVSPETVAELRRALNDNLVLLFRDQRLSQDDQLRFCRHFGDLEVVKTLAPTAEQHPSVMFVTNMRDAGVPTALEDGEMHFHTDQCYYERPIMATTLYAIEVPPEGGNTKFINCINAYDELPDEVKQALDGKRALNIYDYAANATVRTRAPDPKAPRAVQPAVRTHPESGRKGIYVNRLMTDHIVGMDPAESRALLDRVIAHAEAPRFIYEHVWRPGDLVMWDNRSTQHARTYFSPAHQRMMRRVTIQGDRPV